MPVFYLKNIRNNAICSLRFDKVLSCLLEPNVIFRSKIWYKKFIKTFFVSLSNRISWNCFWNNLNNTTDIQSIPCTVTDCLVRKQFKLQIVSIKNLCEKSYYLKGETVLTNIVKNFENTWNFNNLIAHILILHKKLWYSIHFAFIFWRFFISERIWDKLFLTASFTQIHFYIVKGNFVKFSWPGRNVKLHSAFVCTLRMLFRVVSSFTLRRSTTF